MENWPAGLEKVLRERQKTIDKDIILCYNNRAKNATMAQLVEHVIGNDEVPGPNPGSSSRKSTATAVLFLFLDPNSRHNKRSFPFELYFFGEAGITEGDFIFAALVRDGDNAAVVSGDGDIGAVVRERKRREDGSYVLCEALRDFVPDVARLEDSFAAV